MNKKRVLKLIAFLLKFGLLESRRPEAWILGVKEFPPTSPHAFDVNGYMAYQLLI
jgi:hypothetical protein